MNPSYTGWDIIQKFFSVVIISASIKRAVFSQIPSAVEDQLSIIQFCIFGTTLAIYGSTRVPIISCQSIFLASCSELVEIVSFK